MFKYASIALLISLSISSVFGQESLKSIQEDYYDYLSLTGKATRPTLGYRTLSDSKWTPSEDHVWHKLNLGTTHEVGSSSLRLYGPESFTSYNSKCPYGFNDGALWQGRGFNTSLSAGARLEAYGFELTLKPQLSWSENKSFDYFTSEDFDSSLYKDKAQDYGYFWWSSDMPQRFGSSNFFNFDWGDTEIRYSFKNFTVGFGTQNPWLGPAWINPMLGSNNAGGFPKVDIGLRKTQLILPWCHWNLGYVEARLWTGYLSESDYYDNTSSNNARMLNGLSISYAPSFIPGATFGFNRVYNSYWKLSHLRFVAALFASDWIHNDTDKDEGEDQKFSVSVDYLFPKIGFEVYGELGIDDFSISYTSNPFHTAIYTVGLKQAIPIPKTSLKGELIVEWNNFEMSQDFQFQWKYSGYYGHGLINHGYTQKGQILGAGTGYAGNSQYLAYKLFLPRGYVMPYFHRSSPDNNYQYCKAVYSGDTDTMNKTIFSVFKTYKSIGGEALYFINKSFSIKGDFAVIYVNYPDYKKDNKGYLNYRSSLLLQYNL